MAKSFGTDVKMIRLIVFSVQWSTAIFLVVYLYSKITQQRDFFSLVANFAIIIAIWRMILNLFRRFLMKGRKFEGKWAIILENGDTRFGAAVATYCVKHNLQTLIIGSKVNVEILQNDLWVRNRLQVHYLIREPQLTEGSDFFEKFEKHCLQLSNDGKIALFVS